MVYVWLDGILFYKTLDLNEARDVKKYLIEGGTKPGSIEIEVKGDGYKSRTLAQQLSEGGVELND